MQTDDAQVMTSRLDKTNVAQSDGGVYECRPVPPTNDPPDRKDVIVVSREWRRDSELTGRRKRVGSTSYRQCRML